MAKTLLWFRDDLRLDDHLALQAALQAGDETLLVYVFDPRLWARTRGLGIDQPRLGARRARFLRESVADLRMRIQKLGGELLVRTGDPLELLPDLCERWGVNVVFLQAHVADEEVRQEDALAHRLAKLGVKLVKTEGRTLLSKSDLPFALEALPPVFTHFRKKVERDSAYRPPVPMPKTLPPLRTEIEAGTIPTAEQLDTHEPGPPPHTMLAWVGGEGAALHRIDQWMFEADALKTYKETRNGMLEADESSKLSAWLSHGCISPRRVWQEVQRYESERVANDSTYWLIFELLWRDYFAFLALKERGQLFRRSGVGKKQVSFRSDIQLYEAWCHGQTGFPFVDACMRELSSTGFMSNRGRQNVASFLAKTLKVDWRWGAAWFEAQLIDYDPATNWGNWQYAAGVGNDPRDRIFNVVKQAHDYDPDGAFVHRWIPELEDLPGASIHEPWLHAKDIYIEPIISPSAFNRSKQRRS